MNERALLRIAAALGAYPDCPYDNSWPQNEKEEATFSVWALNEILDLVWNHPWTLASDTIDDFAFRLQVYAETSVTPDQKRIFTIAAKAALDILKEIKEVES